MPEGGKLTVASRQHASGNLVEAIIADTGTGIPKENADHIFDPFFTTKKVGEDRGPGLFVSYTIVEKLGGHIRFETRDRRGRCHRQRHHLLCHLATRIPGDGLVLCPTETLPKCFAFFPPP